ncbi:MAG: NAD(P)/FAD-dependent oxidoreductase [Candidatus Aenigmatarchaeota archaeon]
MKIVILGAGISGLTAAITLAKNGYEVVVYEIGKRPKPMFNVSIHSFRNYGIEQGVIKKLSKTSIKLPEMDKIYKIFKFSPSLRKSEIISNDKQPLFYSFLRGKDPRSIDQVLLKQAKKLGVEFHFGETIPKEKANIIATGPKKVDGVAFGYHYKDLNIEDAVYTFYNNRYAPHGYMYILPYKNSGDIVTTTFCSKNEYPKIKKYFFKALKENEIIKEAIRGATKICEVSGYGNFDIPFSAFVNGRYYVGEAAGFQDISKGFGVKFAILSGWLAAKSIINGESYDKLWKKKFLNDLIYYFKRRIVFHKKTNNDFENDIITGKISKTEEEIRKRHSKILDLLYPYYLCKWKILRRI